MILKMIEKYPSGNCLRISMEKVFDDIPKDIQELIVDFNDFEFYGLAETQEYYYRKSKLNINTIKEINLSKHSKKMLEIVNIRVKGDSYV
jgi:hypothetical protein